MPDEFKELLLKDYETRSEAMWKSEQAGETRVNLLIGLITLVGGGVGTLLAKETQFSELSKGLILAALFASLAIGIITLLRLIARNKNTDQCKRQLDLLRQAYRDQFDTAGSWVHYDIFPIIKEKQHGRLLPRELGGLAYVTSGLNASLLAAITGLLVLFRDKDSSLALPVAVAVLIVTFLVQASYVREREKSARERLNKLYPEDTHAGGIIYRIENDAAQYLLVQAKKKDERVFPKGHIERDESHAQAALREVSEEAGVVARIEGLVGRISFKTDKDPVIAKFYLMEKIGDVPTKEKRKPRWFSVADAMDELKYEESRSLLRMAEQRRLS